jgi:ribosomal protein S18 acetylase RimI-like enzyme
MKIRLRQDLHPQADFYYKHQFFIYREPYLLWELEMWEEVLLTSDVYRIEVDDAYGGDIILERKGRRTRYIVDLSILPEHQGKGVGRRVVRHLRKSFALKAITRGETLPFFVKAGFVVKKRIKDYYHPGVDGYYVFFG